MVQVRARSRRVTRGKRRAHSATPAHVLIDQDGQWTGEGVWPSLLPAARPHAARDSERSEHLGARRRAPDSAEYALDLSISYVTLGVLHLKLGDTQRAMEFHGKALEIAEDLCRRAPDSAEYARDLSMSYVTLGDAIPSGR
jgi:hypothetical protein